MKNKIRLRLPERGQVLIMIALAMVGIIAVIALVVDGGNVFLDRRRAQNAADSAALSGALIRIRGGDWVGAALNTAADNGYDNNGKTNTILIYAPPMDGPYKDDFEYVQIIIVSRVNTYFARVFGLREITNTVSATSRTKRPEFAEILNGNAIISLAPTSDCETKAGFLAYEEGMLDIIGGGIFINSNNPECALIEKGSGTILVRGKYQINIVGGASIQKPQLVTPSVSPGAIPVPYPPPFFLPKVKCAKSAEVSADGQSMSPGSWGLKGHTTFPPPGVTRLNRGNYCIKGNFIVDGKLSGSSVVIRVEDGEVRFNGDSTIDLSAPKGGELAGLLIYLPPENRHRVVLNGDKQSSFRGTILAPGADIYLKGNDSKFGFHSQIIGYRIVLGGDSKIHVFYKDDQNYNALTMPQIQLSE